MANARKAKGAAGPHSIHGQGFSSIADGRPSYVWEYPVETSVFALKMVLLKDVSRISLVGQLANLGRLFRVKKDLLTPSLIPSLPRLTSHVSENHYRYKGFHKYCARSCTQLTSGTVW